MSQGSPVRTQNVKLGKEDKLFILYYTLILEKRLHYTFSFPQRGSNFICISSQSCPLINAPPSCPPGYSHVRENSKCGLNCRDIVGYTWRCPCNDWMSCAVKERYLWGCASDHYSSFRVRECVQGLFTMHENYVDNLSLQASIYSTALIYPRTQPGLNTGRPH